MSRLCDSPLTSDVASRWQRALAGSRDGLWEADLRRRTLWCSAGLARLLGLGPGPDGGHGPWPLGDWQHRLHPDDRAPFLQACRHAWQADEPIEHELRCRDASGQWHWLRLTGRLQRGDDGLPAQLSGLATDLQPLRAELDAARQARHDAERALGARAQLMAHIGHEIRTPLTGLMGLNDLALAGTRDPGLRRFLGQARQCGQALQQVVSEVLELAHIEAGQPRAAPRPFDLAQSLADTLRMLMPVAAGRSLLLLYDIVDDRPSGPVWLQGDEVALRQIITNLLGNAIKYTPCGGRVTLTGHLQHGADDRVALRIEVADNGPGIDAEHRAAMFEPFVRGRALPDPGTTGSGLGLAIAQGLAHQMGGALTVDCPAQGGSVFTLALCLPRARPPASARARLPGPPMPAAVAWVVHNLPDGGAWMARRLARAGWRCQSLDSLPQTLASLSALAATDRPDPAALPQLVLLAQGVLAGDETDATDQLRQLRKRLPLATMRLMIQPDWHAPLLEARARRLRITPLVAPLTPAMLHQLAMLACCDVRPGPPDALPAQPPAALAALAAHPPAAGSMPLAAPHQPADAPARPTVALSGPPAEPAAAASPRPPRQRRRRGGDVLLVEDNEVNQLVAREFLKVLGLKVRVASDGAQALAACTAAPPSLVLMDLQLPDMTGLQVTQALRDLQLDGRWPGAPIVALTAQSDPGELAACRAAGMDAVLTKPLSLQALRQRLSRWLLV